MKNSQIAFCDSIETLKTKGYPVEIFTKTSLHLDQGLVEIYVNSPNGPLRCVLDTGSIWNILNTPLKEGESIDEALWDPNNISRYPSIHIEKKDFGQKVFLKIDSDKEFRAPNILSLGQIQFCPIGF